MNKIVKGNWGQGRYQLRPVLDQWVDLQEKFIDVDNDTAFDHTEMANNSILCAAAYCEGWVSMCEVVVERKKGINRSGRGDIYLVPHNKGHGFFIETKLLWRSATSKKFTSKNLNAMKAAEIQAKDLPEFRKDSNYRLFAGLYVVPYFPVGSGQTYSRDDVKKCFLRNVDLLTDKEYDFGTWFFMSPEYGVDAVVNGNYRPGILFGLKEIH